MSSLLSRGALVWAALFLLPACGLAGPAPVGSPADGGSPGDGGAPASAKLSISTTSVDLTACTGATSRTSVTVTNAGGAPAVVQASVSPQGGPFKVSGIPSSAVAPGGGFPLVIEFSPLVEGKAAGVATLEVASGEPNPAKVSLSGSALALPVSPVLVSQPQKTDRSGYRTCAAGSSVDDCELSFPDVAVGSSTSLEFRITNKGCSRLLVNSITVAEPAHFTVTPTTFDLGVNETGTAVVVSRPAQTGYYFSSLSIFSNDPAADALSGAPARLQLFGNALAP